MSDNSSYEAVLQKVQTCALRETSVTFRSWGTEQSLAAMNHDELFNIYIGRFHAISDTLPSTRDDVRTRNKHGIHSRAACCGHCASNSPHKQAQAMHKSPFCKLTGSRCFRAAKRRIARARSPSSGLQTEEHMQRAATPIKGTASCRAQKR